MARPRKRSHPAVSLFPFLSVLACVIGALTLMIAATAIGQVARGAIDLEQFERMERDLAAGRRQLAELTALAEEIDALDAQIGAARQEQVRLAGAAEQARARLESSAPLREALAREQDRLEALADTRDALEASARERRDALERRRQARAAAPILIQPSGSGYGLDPHFAECRSDALVLYEGRARQRTEVPMHRIATSAEYRRFLRSVQNAEGATVVFMIRPGGVATCRQAAIQAGVLRQRYGEIPLPGDGALDFSLLRGAGG
ncbi:MAG: hypothetical protein OEM49_11390 [Myxococcales bacterium]|nr:hypothetical protein [Myxococcales bacterium]MDH5306434.1 hypothetical protein [Myxococcales bacterium]MDH5565269.1 hypothetical protein [Myxococcales bacterium]